MVTERVAERLSERIAHRIAERVAPVSHLTLSLTLTTKNRRLTREKRLGIRGSAFLNAGPAHAKSERL
jgi:hypothetical protein